MKSLLAMLALTTALTVPGLATARPVTLTTTMNAYGGDGAYLACLIRQGWRNVQPLAQAIATRVVPRYRAFMYANTGCLADDQNPRFFMRLNHRIGTQRQCGLTYPALTNFSQQITEHQYPLAKSMRLLSWKPSRHNA